MLGYVQANVRAGAHLFKKNLDVRSRAALVFADRQLGTLLRKIFVPAYVIGRGNLKYAIYVSKNSQVIGPFTKKELREAVHSGNLSWDDWAWHKELPEWKPVHAVLPIIHICRNGQEIAQFDDEKEILSGLCDGTLLMDDYYWCEGMSDWELLSTLEISKAALATTAQKDALKRAGLPFDDHTTKAQVSALFSAGKNGPATAKQLALLNYLGESVSENISKQEAADRIDAVVGDSDRQEKFRDWNDDKLILFPNIFADEIASRKRECLGSYNTFREGLGSEFPKLSVDQANRIFAYLDATSPGWLKPCSAMLIDHFLPCVKAKVHLAKHDS
jgi:GYF domain 2